MSHSPESHGAHHEPSEQPERVPIENPGIPGVDYQVINPNGFTTTHQAPDGSFYTIKNKNAVQAIWRIGVEEKRNNKLKREAQADEVRVNDPVRNGLYRVNAIGTPYRPAPSSEDFIATTDEGEKVEYGVSDNFKHKVSMGTKALNIVGSHTFLSTKNGSEQEAITQHSASIVRSYEARDTALAEGKTIEEAQIIGSEVYREEDAKTPNHPASDDNQEAEEDTETPVTAERKKSRFKPAKKFLKEVGHSVIFGAKLATRKVVPLGTHATYHKTGDKVDETLTKLEAADERYSDIARNIIENLPLLTGLALEQGSKEILMKIDLALDRMTTTAENGIEKSKQFVVDQYHRAIEGLGEQRDRVIKAVIDLYKKTIGKRLRIWARTNPIYKQRADEYINELKKYLSTKHPDKPRYET